LILVLQKLVSIGLSGILPKIQYATDEYSVDPDLQEQLQEVSMPLRKFAEQLREQAGDLVREGGVLLFEDARYKKVDGVLSEI